MNNTYIIRPIITYEIEGIDKKFDTEEEAREYLNNEFKQEDSCNCQNKDCYSWDLKFRHNCRQWVTIENCKYFK